MKKPPLITGFVLVLIAAVVIDLALGALFSFNVVISDMLGLGCVAAGIVQVSPRTASGFLEWKRTHPQWRGLFWGRAGEGIMSDSELAARGPFKIFTGILLILLSLVFFANALAP